MRFSKKVSQKTSHNREEILYERPRKVHFEMHRRDMLEMKDKKRHKKICVQHRKKCCESDASHPIVCGLIEEREEEY